MFHLSPFSTLAGHLARLKGIIDVRDFHVYGGLVLLGYGLYLFHPWLAFSICGAVLLLTGLFYGGYRVKK